MKWRRLCRAGLAHSPTITVLFDCCVRACRRGRGRGRGTKQPYSCSVVETLATMAEQLRQVELLSKCMVKPASPSPPEGRRLCLPSTDIWWITIKNTRRLFLYRLPPHVSLDSVVESLKTSLAKVLVDFYPVAARLALNPDTERPEFDCNDSGAEFIHANVDFPFGELEQDEFAYRDWFSKLVPEFGDLTAFASHPDVPLLSVQVTGFQGGGEGFCIGTAFHHVLGDGRAFSHFMKSWSQLCRGLPQISAKPLHARPFFLQGQPPPLQRRLRFRWVDADVDGIDGVQLFKFVVSDDDDDDMEQRRYAALQAAMAEQTRGRATTQQRTFHVPAEMIARLRRLSGTGARSAFVAVAAHTWRCIAAARGTDDDVGGGRALFAVLADCRGRLKPALPAEYFGNCLTMGMVSAPTAAVVAELQVAVRLVQYTVDTCADEERLRQLLEWVEYDPLRAIERLLGSVMSAPPPNPSTSNVVGSPRFPLYDSDFGWGPPVGVTAKLSDAGCMYFSPPRGGRDGMEVSTLLPEQQMQAFARLFHDLPQD